MGSEVSKCVSLFLAETSETQICWKAGGVVSSDCFEAIQITMEFGNKGMNGCSMNTEWTK